MGLWGQVKGLPPAPFTGRRVLGLGDGLNSNLWPHCQGWVAPEARGCLWWGLGTGEHKGCPGRGGAMRLFSPPCARLFPQLLCHHRHQGTVILPGRTKGFSSSRR